MKLAEENREEIHQDSSLALLEKIPKSTGKKSKNQ
jgi:hypothetical protein